MQTDALSDVLRVLKLSGGMFFRVRLRTPYAITAKDAEAMRQAFAPGADHMLPFHLVTQGPIYFNVDGAGVERLETGDVIVLPHGAGHALANPPDRAPVPVSTFKDQVSGSPPTLVMEGDGEEARALCGFFHCRGRLFNPLMEALPEVLVIRQDPERTPWLKATLERTFDETLGDRPGGTALVERLTGLLFMEVVQRHLEHAEQGGWLEGLTDPVIGKTLKLIHDQPARPWTVDELARRSGASRSVLASRFVELVGMSPFRYLTAWRMELAAARLLETADGLADIASDIGYESEASFSRAFKRLVGEAPSHWRSARQTA
ncbi:MAG: AraC family transcriptional regulator [Proteobacteria bacterium]|nr:AraC family transcriptional regulator [Pseudomonadota bacterium]